MKILLITDIHYGANTIYSHGSMPDRVNSYGSEFESLAPSIHKITREFDMMINLGDLINEHTQKDCLALYNQGVVLLSREHIPLYHVAGNHDLNKIRREDLSNVFKQSHVYYSFDQGGYHHVILDGLRDTWKNPHYITQEQIVWLSKDLTETSLKTIIYCHYPLDEQNLETSYYFKDSPEKAFITNRKELRSLFETSEKVLAVFSGHTHFYNKMSINNIDYVTVPSFSENENDCSRAECLAVELIGNKVVTELIKIK